MRTMCFGFLALSLVLVSLGCSGEPERKSVQVSGTVTFKNALVPAGFISFSPESVEKGAKVVVAQIKDGAFNTADQPDNGVTPGAVTVRIHGFDGKPEKFYPQGKQIFNEYVIKESFTDGTITKTYVVPDAQGKNVKIQPTADE